MTLNLLTLVPEGLVMLTDSLVSSQRTIGGEIERINFQNARKLFHLGEAAPAAVMLNGDANIGGVLISQLLRDASRYIDTHNGQIDHEVCLNAVSGRISAAYDAFIADLRVQVAGEISSNADALAKINEKRKSGGLPALSTVTPDLIAISGMAQQEPPVTEIAPPQVMVILGSYFARPLASVLRWPGAARDDIVTTASSGMWWWGSGGIAITRLMKGVAFDVLFSHAGGDGGAAPAAALKYFEAEENRYAMQAALEIMPVQQAIYFSEYLARVSAGYDRFSVGPHTVGGEMDVVALVDGKLKWIHRQRLLSSFHAPARGAD